MSEACGANFEPYGAATVSASYRLFLVWIRDAGYSKPDTIQCRLVVLDLDGKFHLSGGGFSDENRADALHAVVKVLLKEAREAQK